MAAWHVDFYLVPKRAIVAAPQPLNAAMLEATDWWADAALPADYHVRFDAILPRGTSPSDAETWGATDGNSLEVWLRAGRPSRIRARVDVRRPDAKFAAGLLLFARAAGAALVRGDGSITDPTAGGFGNAMRGSLAWRFVYSAATAPKDDA